MIKKYISNYIRNNFIFELRFLEFNKNELYISQFDRKQKRFYIVGRIPIYTNFNEDKQHLECLEIDCCFPSLLITRHSVFHKILFEFLLEKYFSIIIFENVYNSILKIWDNVSPESKICKITFDYCFFLSEYLEEIEINKKGCEVGMIKEYICGEVCNFIITLMKLGK